MRRATIGFGDPDWATSGGLTRRFPKVRVGMRPVVRVDVVGVEVRPRLIGEQTLGVGWRRYRSGDIATNNDARVTGFEAELGRLLPRTHLINRVRAERRDVAFVPWFPRRDPPFEPHRQRAAQFVNMTQVCGEPPTASAFRLRPRRRVVKNLEHLKSRVAVRIGGGVVSGWRWSQSARLQLNLPPTEPITNPAHARQRGEVRQFLLLSCVVRRKPSGGGVHGHGRILRHRASESLQHCQTSPGLIGLICGSEFEPVPADAERAKLKPFSKTICSFGQAGLAQHVVPIIQQ